MSNPCRRLAKASKRFAFGTTPELTASSTLHDFVTPVYVLHAFEKKTQATPRKDIALAKERFGELMRSKR